MTPAIEGAADALRDALLDDRIPCEVALDLVGQAFTEIDAAGVRPAMSPIPLLGAAIRRALAPLIRERLDMNLARARVISEIVRDPDLAARGLSWDDLTVTINGRSLEISWRPPSWSTWWMSDFHGSPITLLVSLA